jgi:hypothetical protein
MHQTWFIITLIIQYGWSLFHHAHFIIQHTSRIKHETCTTRHSSQHVINLVVFITHTSTSHTSFITTYVCHSSRITHHASRHHVNVTRQPKCKCQKSFLSKIKCWGKSARTIRHLTKTFQTFLPTKMAHTKRYLVPLSERYWKQKTFLFWLKCNAQTFLSEPDLMKLVP